MAFPLFKDVGKSNNDLLKKGFPANDKFLFRVELDSTSQSGIQFIPHIQETQAKTLEGELKSKFEYKNLNFTAIGNLKEDVSLEATPTKATNGFKWTLVANSNMSNFVDRLKGKCTLELRNDFTTSALSIEGTLKKDGGKSEDNPKILFSSVFGLKERGVFGGIDLEIAPTSQDIKTVNTALGLTKSDSEISLFSKTKVGTSTTVGAIYFQKYPYLSRDILLGGELAYDLNSKKPTPTLTLGSQFKPDDDTTIKTRVDSKGQVGLAITEKWRGPLSVTLAADLNVLGVGVGGGGENPSSFQYGLKFAFK